MARNEVGPSGPSDADLMIVGEAPGAEEARSGVPFVGASGQELDRMLHEAGILRHDCFVTNVVREQPPGNNIKHFFPKKLEAAKRGLPEVKGRWPTVEVRRGLIKLTAEIERVRPRVILALGDTALWALTGNSGITKWRGSMLWYESPEGFTCRVVPTYHPAAILRMWEWRTVAVYDLRRAERELNEGWTEEPEWKFTVPKSINTAIHNLVSLKLELDKGPLLMSVDIETRFKKYIDCIGIGLDHYWAMCIPLMTMDPEKPNYWTAEEEHTIILALRDVLTHPNARVIGQNFLYDNQYFARQYGFLARCTEDTMVMQGTLYPGMPKGLDYLSSVYCEWHSYWKDEGKDALMEVDDEKRWRYNCRDCCATYEAGQTLLQVLESAGLLNQYRSIMRKMPGALRSQLRGTRIRTELRSELDAELLEEMLYREHWFQQLWPEGWETAKTKGAKPWYRSAKQLAMVFYHWLAQPLRRHRKTGNPTTDDEALQRIGENEPLLLPLTRRLQEYRSLSVFLQTFVRAPLDHDKRMRCSYNLVGTETFRLNSTEDAFGFGTNLQNIPAGDKE